MPWLEFFVQEVPHARIGSAGNRAPGGIAERFDQRHDRRVEPGGKPPQVVDLIGVTVTGVCRHEEATGQRRVCRR